MFLYFLGSGGSMIVGFQGKGHPEAGVSSRANGLELGQGFCLCEDWNVIDGSDVGTGEFVVGSTRSGCNGDTAGLGINLGEKHSLHQFISHEIESKVLTFALHLDGDFLFFEEGVGLGGEFGSGGGVGISRQVMAVQNAFHVHHIGGNVVARQIGHAFIKASMVGYLDALGVVIKPKQVLGGVGQEAKESSLGGMGFVLGGTTTWGSNPDTAAEGFGVGQIILLVVQKFAGRLASGVGLGIVTGILDPQDMFEGTGPEFDI